MTFNKDDILARLHNGDSVDDIAQEMAEALNAAKTSYDEAEAKRIEEEKKLEAEKANQEARTKAKRVAVAKMIDSVVELANMEGKHDLADKLIALSDTELDDIAETIVALFELVEMTEQLSMLEFGGNLFKKLEVKKVKPSADDIIRDFLKTL